VKLSLFLLLLLFACAQAHAQSLQAATPEMKRLQDAFVGEWKTQETMEQSKFFPNGGGRTGHAAFRIGSAGYTLVGEGRSDGSAGQLSFMIVIWWEPEPSLYRYFVCFNGQKRACRIRGTAHWEGRDFVNDYDEPVDGKPKQFRDTFSNITAEGFTLVEAMKTEDGSLKPLITTRNQRVK